MGTYCFGNRKTLQSSDTLNTRGLIDTMDATGYEPKEHQFHVYKEHNMLENTIT
jgi:hypothetical protein